MNKPRIPTPRTDALADRFGNIDPENDPYWKALDLATELERELAARPEEKPIDLMAELRKKLPQGMPVAWRYRLKPKTGKEPMAWKYVDRADEVNPLDAYESEPMYSAPSPQRANT